MNNRYIVTLPLIVILPVICGLLYYALFNFKKARRLVRLVVPALYAIVNAYLVYADSFLGVVQSVRERQPQNDSIFYSFVGAEFLIVGFAALLWFAGFILIAPGLNYALYRKIGAPRGYKFWEFLERMEQIRQARKPERKPLRQRIKDFFNLDEEEDDDGVYFNVK